MGKHTVAHAFGVRGDINPWHRKQTTALSLGLAPIQPRVQFRAESYERLSVQAYIIHPRPIEHQSMSKTTRANGLLSKQTSITLARTKPSMKSCA